MVCKLRVFGTAVAIVVVGVTIAQAANLTKPIADAEGRKKAAENGSETNQIEVRGRVARATGRLRRGGAVAKRLAGCDLRRNSPPVKTPLLARGRRR